jgi:hypothetical protein
VSRYRPNPACRCRRCRARILIAPISLVALGVLFLLGKYTHYSFSQTWPLLLIVIVLARILLGTRSAEGHQQPGRAAVSPPEHRASRGH